MHGTIKDADGGFMKLDNVEFGGDIDGVLVGRLEEAANRPEDAALAPFGAVWVSWWWGWREVVELGSVGGGAMVIVVGI